MKISEIKRSAPEEFSTSLQQKIYETLAESGIEFTRVDNEPAVTVESCEELSRVLEAPTVKSLLVANRQLTNFYLVVMPGHKPFVTREFTHALGVSRVSFVKPEVLLDMLQVEVGATTPLSIIADKENKIRLILDEELRNRDCMLIPDGTTTCYMNVSTADYMQKYLPLTGHHVEWAHLEGNLES